MTKVNSIIKGVTAMPDFLPEDATRLEFLEARLNKLAHRYGYSPIRLPILEYTHLFKRSIGEVTDIVEKEMFTFLDNNSESLTLRPEGTAGCVRSCIEHSLLRNQQVQKLFYLGNMYRYEKKQLGRYRQFNQFGIEAFNLPGPDIDAEQIVMIQRLWQELGLDSCVHLEINSLGSASARSAHKAKLLEYFNDNKNNLDEDSLKRLDRNPLRILDSKNSEMQEMLAAAPKIMDFLEPECAEHFAGFSELLTKSGVNYTVNHRLIRGLDYYNRTVYEWTTKNLGSQGTVCAGGRYDTLVGSLGGPETPAVGFSLGVERVLLLLQDKGELITPSLDVYLICSGSAYDSKIELAEMVRTKLPSCSVKLHYGNESFKKKFQKADKSGASLALVIGDDELQTKSVTIKYLRQDKPQHEVSFDELATIVGG